MSDFKEIIDVEAEKIEKTTLQRKIIQLQSENKELSSINKKLQNEIILEEKKLATILKLKTQERIPKIRPQKGQMNQATAVAALGDIHVEEKVNPKTVNDLNEYNLEISSSRVDRFFINCLKVINALRNSNNINNFVLALLGDNITGHIHEEFRENNFLSPTQASLYVKNMIKRGIDFLLEYGEFETIIINCNYGNHGRLTKYRPHSTKAEQSYEWLIYNVLQDEYKDNEKIQFNIAGGALLYHDIYGYMIRFHHGDSIRYGGGVGGITIPLNKAIQQWNKSIKADLDVLGHWHQTLDIGHAIVNGSVIGYNAYAVEIKAEFEKPQQTLFLVDAKRKCKTIKAPIWLD